MTERKEWLIAALILAVAFGGAFVYFQSVKPECPTYSERVFTRGWYCVVPPLVR